MTVKELKEELEFYDDDSNVVFEFCGDVEVESTTVDKYGNTSVYVDTKLKPSFICDIRGDMNIELEVET